MSRETPKLEYKSKIVKFGNGARIKGYKAHIGLIAKIIICNEEEWMRMGKTKKRTIEPKSSSRVRYKDIMPNLWGELQSEVIRKW